MMVRVKDPVPNQQKHGIYKMTCECDSRRDITGIYRSNYIYNSDDIK